MWGVSPGVLGSWTHSLVIHLYPDAHTLGSLLTRVMSVSEVTPTLFLGGADASLDDALLRRKRITLIVNATVGHPSPARAGVECVRVAVSDVATAPLGDHFDRVAARIHGNRSGATLVHCAAGLSRSPALVMAYLMRYRGATLGHAHAWVRQSRPHVRLNAGFWEQLLRYERRLYGRNTVRVQAPRDDQAPLPGHAAPPAPLRLAVSAPAPSRLLPPPPPDSLLVARRATLLTPKPARRTDGGKRSTPGARKLSLRF